MSLDCYVGEFLVSPIPLELSLHWCSHQCHYCFANLNTPTRHADVGRIMRLIRTFRARQTLTAHWLQGGYPVCLSNRVDPFAASNLRDALPLIDALCAEGVPIQFQTRGAHDPRVLTALLPRLPTPWVWYVSIEVWDDAIRRQITPGAPSIARRLALIDLLVQRGHVVVVGLNPCVPAWLPADDATQLLDALAQRGVWGVWIERLHLSAQQARQFTPAGQQALAPVLGTARARRTPPAERSFLDRVRAAAQDRGLQIFSVGQPNASAFFDPYHRCYPTIPTMQDVVNHCHAHLQPGALIDFATFAAFFVPQLPAGIWPADGYVGATSRQLWRTQAIPPRLTFADLLAIIYREPRCRQCPARLPSFAYAARWDGDGWVQLVDTEGMPYLVWSPRGHTEYYTAIDGAGPVRQREGAHHGWSE